MKQSGMIAKGKGAEAEDAMYLLRLFVAGDEPNSKQARQNLARLGETHLKGRCEIEVIDVLNDFQTALENNILVTPTLVVVAPPPVRTILGNLSHIDKVLTALRLPGGKS